MKYVDIENAIGVKSGIIFARHAARYEIENLSSHHEVLLTEKGINDSFLFGRKISSYPGEIQIYHSTVSRCRQTAENIYKGIMADNGKAVMSGELQWLLGNYIFDKEFIDRYIGTHDVNAFLRAWFDGKLSRDIVTPVDEISNGFLTSLRNQFAGNSANSDGENQLLTVDISHDWNMSIMLEYFMGLKHEDIGIPVFLDYIIFRNEGKKIKMIYHDHETDIIV